MDTGFIAGGPRDAAPDTGGFDPAQTAREDFDCLVDLIFEELPLQGRLCDGARRKGFGEAPWQLPAEAQRALVAAMIEVAGEAPHSIRPEPKVRWSVKRLWKRWNFAPSRLFANAPDTGLAGAEAAAE